MVNGRRKKAGEKRRGFFLFFISGYLYAVFLLSSPCYPLVSDVGKQLSDVITNDFMSAAAQTQIGTEIIDSLTSGKKGRGGMPGIYFRTEEASHTAGFDDKEWKIYFNLKYVAEFFGVKKYDDKKMIRALLKNSRARAKFVDTADVLYVHELVHADQYRRYPNYSRDGPPEKSVEFEYEAYFKEDLYFHEKIKRSPGILRKFLKTDDPDIYTEHALGSYLSLSLDVGEYKRTIRKRYETQDPHYVTLEKAETMQSGRAEESRILGLASGKLGDYFRKLTSADELRKQKAQFDAYLDRFYRHKWPLFSTEALLLVGKAALDVKNYPLALQCLAIADSAAADSSLNADLLKELKENGAVAVLQASAFIKDKWRTMKLSVLSEHLKSLETACDRTSRPFPRELLRLKIQTYPKAAQLYRSKIGDEKDPELKKLYIEYAKFFASRMK